MARSNSGGSDDATLLHSIEHARGDKTKRNPKQQLQNKQAQQRYRSDVTARSAVGVWYQCSCMEILECRTGEETNSKRAMIGLLQRRTSMHWAS